MNVDAGIILQTITLAVVGWSLLAIVDLKTDVAGIKQQLKDSRDKQNRYTETKPE